MSNVALEMKNIEKEYFNNKVLKGIDLKIKPGEIHAILGENGAGKSTLMNILFGMPVIHSTGGYTGDILIDGKKVDIKSPKEAMDLGIGMVHQEFMLIPGFTITENVKLNREKSKSNLISKILGEKLETLDVKSMNQDTRKALDKLEMDIEEWSMVEGLPVGYKQFIEIAREIDKSNIKVLVFDEPTAVLTESEAENLLSAMKKLATDGIAIVFITHRLEEVMMVSDNITILRDGELVASKPKKDTNIIELAQLMVGRKIEKIANAESNEEEFKNKKVILSIKNFEVDMPGETAKGINLEVRKGEILGIGGLAGQGKIGIANGLMGLYESSGEVTINNKKLNLNDTTESLNKGLSFVSEDRRGVGLLLDTSIEMNIVLTAIQMQGRYISKIGPFTQKSKKEIRSHALKMIKDLDIRCRGPEQITRRLSGGNQQKVCIARALTLKPDILLVSEPTRGIDIGAKKLVLDLLYKLNKELGMTIIMTSSELAELRTICHRIAIIAEGKVEGILSPDESDVTFGLMMAGEYNKINKKGAL
ncbi:sugar ABC transporter ATP-binding protein [Clostridium sp. D2Q-11]|uniref:Sugar ABC transporter ATP-binding protein n=1 Tax=Anaeromonas frigoriresistens TaxID=2683708 RepID=A0A942UW35_9FIRM|nr:sugar ABC transporter ATP-binding protein [Anaeromonas frigoriresistens]MBS4539668.1 sugar ABC transporter ATP-binding protein [Anaeromonas frigoriresistens]